MAETNTTASNGAATTPSVTNSTIKPSILQISRPYFTTSEISYLHSQTIPEHKKLNYNQKKHQIFHFLLQLVKGFKFPLRVLATAMNYYQRYYLFNKFEDLNEGDVLSSIMYKSNVAIIQELEKDCYIVAIGCLFLASKNEDCIKKLRDVQIMANKLRDIEDESKSNSNPQPGQGVLENQRKAIMAIEFKLLQIIKFDFNNGCPQESLDQLVAQFSKQLQLDYKASLFAWLVSFDLISTPVYLMIPPHCIALAIIIITLNIKPNDIKSKYQQLHENDVNYSEILDRIDNEDFKCPELLVNEGILYILDYYVHQMKFSILNSYLPPIDADTGKEQIFKFMELKSRFNDLQCIQEKSITKNLLNQDDYLNNWNYSLGVKGSARFMTGNKRRRFDIEVEIKKSA